MNPYFSTESRVAYLAAIAKTWLGTPFMPHASIKGKGVSCQMLAGAIYREVGFLDEAFAIPEGPLDWSRAHKESQVGKLVDSMLAAEFISVTGKPQAGDLIGFRVHACVQHLGVCLGLTFIHCLMHKGVMLSRIDDATYSNRINRIWRPIEYGHGTQSTR